MARRESLAWRDFAAYCRAQRASCLAHARGELLAMRAELLDPRDDADRASRACACLSRARSLRDTARVWRQMAVNPTSAAATLAGDLS